MFPNRFVKESMLAVCLLVLGGFFLFSDVGKEAPGMGMISQVDDREVPPIILVTPKSKIGDKKQNPGLSPSLSPKPSMSPPMSPSPRLAEDGESRRAASVTNDMPTHFTQTLVPSQSTTPTVTVVPTHTPSPLPSAWMSPTPLPAGGVVINEIAWAGTKANAADEWVELFNSSGVQVDVSGWALYEGDVRIISLSGMIPAGGYFLIERTDDTTVADITADMKGPFSGSGLRNEPGEHLQLRDASGQVTDAVDCSGGAWFAGSSQTKTTMERIDPSRGGNEPENWKSNDGATRNGIDAAGNLINGTPRAKNSVQ